jgi:hypothetical protein
MSHKYVSLWVDYVVMLECQLKNSLTFPQIPKGNMKETNLIFLQNNKTLSRLRTERKRGRNYQPKVCIKFH